MRRDEESVLLAKYALDKLGCPNVREAEGNPEFQNSGHDLPKYIIDGDNILEATRFRILKWHN
ncbi:MAG: hypothetical protein P4L59_00680 [Desulfosporosinus sp.]|nr:hypothetical protein [Desulfosporosinus sp.]